MGLLMRNLVVVLVIIAGISLSGLASCANPAAKEPSGEQNMGNMLNKVMDYIRQNHLDAAPFIKENVTWAESGLPKRMGYTGYTYTGGGWIVTIGHAITAEILYDVRAEYSAEGIVWVGMVKDDVVAEESYTRK